MQESPWNRLWHAPVLPYRPGTLEPDLAAYRAFLDRYLQPRYIEAGVAIIANPEAGELCYLSREEKLTNVEIAVEAAGGRVPVFAGVVDITTAGAIDVARDAMAAGADGLFVLPPMGALDVTITWDPVRYPEIVIDMWRAIADATGSPPMIAHPTAPITPLYGVGFPVEAVLAVLDQIPEIVAWKMTYKYVGYRIVAKAIRQLDRPITILASGAAYFHEILAGGLCDGMLSGSFNYSFEPMLDHIDAWKRNDVVAARAVWDGGLRELQEYVYSDFSRLHIRYKIAAWLRGLIDDPFMRPPLPRPMRDEIDRLAALLAVTGLTVRADGDISDVKATLSR